jgi:integrase
MATTTTTRTTRADRGRGRVPGLALREMPDGSTVFWFRFRLHGRALSWSFKAPTLSEARRVAEDARVKVSRGEDPRPPRALARRLTLGRLAALWLRSREAKRWRPATLRSMRSAVALHVLPGFRTRDPNQVARAELWRKLRELADRAPTMANRSLTTWRMLYRWARAVEQEDLGVTTDPTADLRRPGGPERPRDRVLSDDELRRTMATCAGDLRDLVDMVLHCGTRIAETLAARWPDVDLDRATWTIPAEHSKSRRARTVPLSTGALDVLRRRDPSRYLDPRVFPRVFPGKLVDAASARLGWRLRFHDLRRTCADRIRQHFDEATMHGVLGHTDALLTRTYGPSPRTDALRAALQWWSDELARISGA